MKKVLVLCLHRPNRSPSQRFRIEEFLPYLEKHGYSFDYSYLLNEKDDRIFYRPGHAVQKGLIVMRSIWKRWRNVLNAGQYDLAFVQREAFMLGTSWFEKKVSAKIPLIFDFDDAIWMQNVSEANKSLSFLKNANKTSDIISHSAMIFAGNQYLADYARGFNKNVFIVPSTIDTDIYKPPVKPAGQQQVCIGWSGSFSTVQHFATAIPALKKIKDKYGEGVRFKIIGDPNYYCEELDTKGVKWAAATEVQDLYDIDIGIMPLPDDEWAKGKCGMKGLQYMGVGIPTLMSPVGVNTQIITDGVNGYLPSSEEEWVNRLSQLIENEQLRNTIGNAGRETIVKKYSVDAWKTRYLEYFNQLTNKENK